MMRIDIDNVLRERAPRYHRYIPRWMVRWLERTICQDRLNYILEHNYPATGADFADGALNDMGVTYDLAGQLPDPSRRRVILVSNHPLGGLDGLVLASAARRIYGGSAEDVKFVVNDLLDFVEPLRPIFLGVNKHGSQSRAGADSIDKAFAGDEPIIMFPAGLVSRMGKDGKIADLDWHKMAVVRAISYHRDIIPVHFSGENSRFFYKFAQLRSRLGLRFNIEMIRLPKEMILSEGSHFTITFGAPVPWTELRGGKEALAQADKLRSIVYKLPSQ
jgi:putative hemolysin